jgi:SAM-dependent methyltransferase
MPSLLRALRRRGRTDPPVPGGYDSWLEHVHGGELERIDAACAGGGPECYALFRALDVDTWALLLTQEYEAYPNIRALLPDVPDAALQQLWNGTSGAALAAQGAAFYRKLCERYGRHGDRPLAESTVLDFGCGWGRLTRFLARDVQPGRVYGCDPVEQILDVCRQTRVPATFARSDFVPERVPFEGPFDLAFAFSVFTHLSERAHEACLRALHGALRPGAILIVTIRPPAYMGLKLPPGEARYVFRPHPAEPSHLQYGGSGEMHYGETVVTLPYVHDRWAPLFEPLAADLLIGDLHQVMVTLRRR